MTDTVVICYRKKQGNIPDYETIPYADLDTWRNMHPDCSITHVFPTQHNLTNYDDNLRNEFLRRCQEYSMKPEDLDRQYVDNKGNRYCLMGLQPKNTKYKFIIRHANAYKRFKVTPQFMKSLAPLAVSVGGN